jgi:tetratricopeptide (TPR) repeat protein
LSTMKNLGSLYKSQGRYADAEKLYRRSLEGYEKMLGADHPLTLRKVERLALLYQKQERYDAAEELLMYALTNTKKQLGADNPWTEDLARSLYELYEAQGLECDACMIYT